MTAWTAPRTWTDLEFVGKSIMDPHVRDNLTHLKEKVTGVYVKGTSNVGPTSGTTVLDVISCTAITGDGATPWEITVDLASITFTVASDVFEVRIQNGATQLHSHRIQAAGAVSSAQAGSTLVTINVPAAGSQTYKATIVRVAGTGTATVAGSSTSPILIAARPFA